MAHHDLEALFAPLADDAPSGPDLEYDPEFQTLEREATPKAERAVGDSVKAAEEPDWDKVASLSESLFGRSRDLRVALCLTSAWTRQQGLAGWADGLALVHGLLENLWDSVHPQLDAEDDNDPTARVNAVMPLTDMQTALGLFRSTHFVQSPRLGRFSLRDLRIAEGTLKVAAAEDGSAPPSLTDIEACCLDCPEEQLTGAAEAVASALAHARAIDVIFTDRIGTAGPDLKPLQSEIYELKKFLDAQVAKRLPAAEADTGDETGAVSDGEGGGNAAKAGASRGIESPQDVIRRLDEICDYYARREPSSPIPHLLRRAQRLVGLNFIDLMKELAPGGLSEFQVISGTSDE